MARLVSCCVLFLFKDMPTQCDWTVIRLQLPGLAGQLPERVALASSDWLGGVPRQSNEKGLDEKETRRGRRRRTRERREKERRKTAVSVESGERVHCLLIFRNQLGLSRRCGEHYGLPVRVCIVWTPGVCWRTLLNCGRIKLVFPTWGAKCCVSFPTD